MTKKKDMVEEIIKNENDTNESVESENVKKEVVSEKKKTSKTEIKIGKVVDCLRLNVREKPSTSSASLITLACDTLVDVYGVADGWAKIKCQGISKYGYCMVDYISIK